MAPKKISQLGERGFLRQLLPLIQTSSSAQFLVPPGDDAAVLNFSHRPVLSIDGLTEGTHFLWSWKNQCEKKWRLSFGRALGWKLMGSALSDLAAMGKTKNRWAMVYLAAPPYLDQRFLMELYKGVRETADTYSCALAGGDTVKAKDLSLVAAVGADLVGKKAFQRSGAQLGDAIAIVGQIGDAGMGLAVLQKEISLSMTLQRRFVKRFFQHKPLFEDSSVLAETAGVHSLMDLSDSLPECLELLLQASHCGADINLNSIPASGAALKCRSREKIYSQSGEDYALLLTGNPKILQSLRRKIPLTVIGQITSQKLGLRLFQNGIAVKSPRYFQQFSLVS